MTTLQLNSELLRQLSYIVGDDNMMKKVIAYIKRLRSQSVAKKGGALGSPDDPTLKKEAEELYGLFRSDDLSDEDLSEMVGEARREVYGK